MCLYIFIASRSPIFVYMESLECLLADLAATTRPTVYVLLCTARSLCLRLAISDNHRRNSFSGIRTLVLWTRVQSCTPRLNVPAVHQVLCNSVRSLMDRVIEFGVSSNTITGYGLILATIKHTSIAHVVGSTQPHALPFHVHQKGRISCALEANWKAYMPPRWGGPACKLRKQNFMRYLHTEFVEKNCG